MDPQHSDQWGPIIGTHVSSVSEADKSIRGHSICTALTHLLSGLLALTVPVLTHRETNKLARGFAPADVSPDGQTEWHNNGGEENYGPSY